MATERIATFFPDLQGRLKNRIRAVRRYHNAKPGRITEAQEKCDFLPFIYSGATVSRTGDNVTSELTLSSNDIAGQTLG